MLSSEYCKIFKNTFFCRTPSDDCLCGLEISVKKAFIVFLFKHASKSDGILVELNWHTPLFLFLLQYNLKL